MANGLPPTLRTLVERQFRGLNLSASPEALQDGEFLELSELMPYATGNLVVVPGASNVATAPGPIQQIWAHRLNNIDILIVQLTSGALYEYQIVAKTFTQIGTITTTINGLSVAKWNGPTSGANADAILISDTTLGYGYWNGTTWTLVDATLTGQALGVYAGRVWMAQGYTVLFTSAGDYTDFSSASAGSFIITDEAMSAPPVAIVTSQGWLYIIGPAIIALNNVNVPPGQAQPSYFKTLLSATIGIRNPNAAFVQDTVLVLCTDTGVWGVYGLTTQRINQNMGDVFSGDDEIGLSEVFGEFVLVFSNRYCLMLSSGAWFSTFQITGNALATSNTAGTTCYMAQGDVIWSLFGSPSTPMTAIANTKLYDVGAPYINKQVTRYGVEVYQSELSPSGLLTGLTMELQGFSANPTTPYTQHFNQVKTNEWVRAFTSFTDRYMSARVTLNASAGTSIGAFFFEFQLGATWP